MLTDTYTSIQFTFAIYPPFPLRPRISRLYQVSASRAPSLGWAQLLRLIFSYVPPSVSQHRERRTDCCDGVGHFAPAPPHCWCRLVRLRAARFNAFVHYTIPLSVFEAEKRVRDTFSGFCQQQPPGDGQKLFILNVNTLPLLLSPFQLKAMDQPVAGYSAISHKGGKMKR